MNCAVAIAKMYPVVVAMLLASTTDKEKSFSTLYEDCHDANLVLEVNSIRIDRLVSSKDVSMSRGKIPESSVGGSVRMQKRAWSVPAAIFCRLILEDIQGDSHGKWMICLCPAA
jgi:hypothetical protein